MAEKVASKRWQQAFILYRRMLKQDGMEKAKTQAKLEKLIDRLGYLPKHGWDALFTRCGKSTKRGFLLLVMAVWNKPEGTDRSRMD